jgi:hypothetical protein
MLAAFFQQEVLQRRPLQFLLGAAAAVVTTRAIQTDRVTPEPFPNQSLASPPKIWKT